MSVLNKFRQLTRYVVILLRRSNDCLFANIELISYGRDALTDFVDDKRRLKTKRKQCCSTTPDLADFQRATKAPPRTYRYRQLSGSHSIRLLRFLPGSNSEHVRCTIDEYDPTTSDVPYAALSYVWGDDARVRHPITLNGRTAYITSNLKEALVQLAEDFSQWSFWIDAICIDQNNTEEKMHQVAQMRTIYSNAAGVVMWLGPGHEHVERLASVIEYHYNHCQCLQDLSKRCGRQIDSGLVAAMQYLLERPYWQRMWIIQEVVVSKGTTIMCGTTLLHLKSLSLFLGMVYFGHFTLPQGLELEQACPGGKTFHIMRIYSMYRTCMDLANALMFTSSSLATDSRDEVYALLGLVNIGAGRLISADYTLSPCNVYCLAIRAMSVDCCFERDAFDWHGFIDSIPKICLDDTLQRERASASKKAGRHWFKSRRLPWKATGSSATEEAIDGTECDGRECGTRSVMRNLALWSIYPELESANPLIRQPSMDSPSASESPDAVKNAPLHKFFTEYNTTSLLKECNNVDTKRPFCIKTAKHMVLAGLYLSLHPISA
jgi:hypothetical protein